MTTDCRSRKPLIRNGRYARSGSITFFLLAGLVVVFGLIAGAWYFFGREKEDLTEVPILYKITRGPYKAVVLDQGEVESSNNVIIRSEVKSMNSQGTTILDVVPEGTLVKGGEWLCTLDSSALESERDAQQIVVNTSEASKTQAQSTLEASEIAREEYVEGTFIQEEQTIQNEIFEAEENLRKAEQYLKYSEQLAAKGFVTSLQLEADRFAVERAKNTLKLSNNKLDVLRNQTRRKMLAEFDALINAASVLYENEQKSHEIELAKLAEVDEQISNCEIFVPEGFEGQVVHANKYSRRGGSAEFVVEAGAFVREKQDIIKLPDIKQMQVNATVNESRITRVKEGMPVNILLDALQAANLEGVVIKVNQYAEPAGFGGGGIKRYGVVVSIVDPPAEIRPGMNASVSILVEEHDDAIQIPLQAIYEVKGHTFCLVQRGPNDWETREITLASNNEEFARVTEGLDEGDVVVQNPRRHPDKLQIPDLPDEDLQAEAGPEGRIAGPPGQPLPPTDQPSPVEQFTMFDRDGDKLLSDSELAPQSEQVRTRLLTEYDADKDGLINLNEFLKFAADRKQLRQQVGAGAGDDGGGGD